MSSGNGQQQREVVYCHQCENEWYRHEHGLICPECQSEFVQIIEGNSDPRMEEQNAPSPESESHFRQPTHEWYAPDPDEDDIEQFGWRDNTQDQRSGQHYHASFARGMGGSPEGQDRAQGQGYGQGQPQGLLGLLGTIFGGAQQQQQQQQQYGQHYGQHYGQQQQQHPPPQDHQHWAQGDDNPRSIPGSPGGNTVVHRASGPNFSVTFTTTTNTNLYPRNANSPQAFQAQPQQIEELIDRMFMNIGAMQGHGFAGGMRMGPGGQGFAHMGGAGGGGGGGLVDLFSILMPPGGVHGDAVYSQDAFDRVITQLMEQHQSGNAPGPASTAAIDALPTRTISAADQSNDGSGSGSKAECSICMDEAPLGAQVTVLPCDHWFHHECIKAWLSEHDTCPHCRRGIMAKDGPTPPASSGSAAAAAVAGAAAATASATPDHPYHYTSTASGLRQPSQPPLHDMNYPPEYLPRAPGAFPLPRRESASAGPASPSPRSPGESTGSMISRMREVFGRGNSHGSSGDGGQQR